MSCLIIPARTGHRRSPLKKVRETAVVAAAAQGVSWIFDKALDRIVVFNHQDDRWHLVKVSPGTRALDVTNDASRKFPSYWENSANSGRA